MSCTVVNKLDECKKNVFYFLTHVIAKYVIRYYTVIVKNIYILRESP